MARKNPRRRAKITAKRKARAATIRNQRASRADGGSPDYWLTLVSTKTCCARCAGILKLDAEMVYRHVPREALCLACATREKIDYRPSIRWERARKTKRKPKRGSTWMRD